MFFFRAFTTVLFIFGFSANMPGFVNGLVVASPRSLLSTEAMTRSDIITERQLNDNGQESEVFEKAAVIQRGVPVSITSGGRGNRGGRKPQKDDEEGGGGFGDVSQDDGSHETEGQQPEPDGTHRTHHPVDPEEPDQCKKKNITPEQRRRCNKLSPSE